MRLWMIIAVAVGLSIDDFLKGPLNGIINLLTIFVILYLCNWAHLKYFKKATDKSAGRS